MFENTPNYETLPAAARRWLDAALPVDFNEKEPVTTVELTQDGQMDIRGRWTPFTAKGIYTAVPLSFNWQAKLSAMPGVWIMAEDGHRDGQGWGGAKLWGVIPMGRRTDPEVLKTQLVRNLAELALMPAIATADPELIWEGIDDATFEVRKSVAGQEAVVRFELDDRGDVIRASSPSRPYDVPDGYEEAPWFYIFSDHQEFSGMRAPGTAVATYEKSDGPWEYFHGRTLDVKNIR